VPGLLYGGLSPETAGEGRLDSRRALDDRDYVRYRGFPCFGGISVMYTQFRNEKCRGSIRTSVLPQLLEGERLLKKLVGVLIDHGPRRVSILWTRLAEDISYR
jgi:hypothetical protein